MTIVVSDTIRARLDAAPMSRVQIGAVALTAVLSALDGYDVLSVTFVAPAVTVAWEVGKAALGVVLASGLAGMALGSFVLAPLADVVGRRRMILIALVLMAIGSLLSAFATSVPQLAGWRVVTGLGIGTCIAVNNPLAAEFANAHRRALAVALMALGYPVGGLIGGVLAAVLLHAYAWPAVFIAGFVAAIVLLAVVIAFLPESPAYLASRDRPDSLAALNSLLRRCGQPPVAALPIRRGKAARGYAAIFAPGQISTTLRIAAFNLIVAGVFYYVFSWLPQMVADAGFDASRASLVTAVASLAGIGGCLAMGLLARRFGANRLTVGTTTVVGVATAALGFAPASLPLLMAVAAIAGFVLYGGAAGFYAVIAASFVDDARAAGAGFVIGVGRVSSAASPLLAGWLFASGLGRAEVSLMFGAASLVGAFVLSTNRTVRIAL